MTWRALSNSPHKWLEEGEDQRQQQQRPPPGRGLNSSTVQLNVSAFIK